jgi:hypothetical protein
VPKKTTAGAKPPLTDAGLRDRIAHCRQEAKRLEGLLAKAEADRDRLAEARQEAVGVVVDLEDADEPAVGDLDLLGLRQGFSAAELRQAYRSRALEAHPDRGGKAWLFDCLTKARERLARCLPPEGAPDRRQADAAFQEACAAHRQAERRAKSLKARVHARWREIQALELGRERRRGRHRFADADDPHGRTHFILWVALSFECSSGREVWHSWGSWRQLSRGCRAVVWGDLFAYLDLYPDHHRPAWFAVVDARHPRNHTRPPQLGRTDNLCLEHGWVRLPEGGGRVVVPPPSLRPRR